MYKIYPLPNAEPVEVYCEMAIAGGGFAFLSKSLSLRVMPSRSSTPSSKTINTFCSSCRKNSLPGNLTLWSSHIQITMTFLSEFWSTTILVTLNQRTSPWKNTSSSGSFPSQPPQIKITRVSNPTETSSSLKTVTQIPTACLRSCQTIIFNVHSNTIITTGTMKMMVSQ